MSKTLKNAKQAAHNNPVYLEDYLALAANEAEDQTETGRCAARYEALDAYLKDEDPAELLRQTLARIEGEAA